MNNTPAWVKLSPWLDRKKSNLFRYELQLARENATEGDFKPLRMYRWIYRHGGENLLFKGLAHFAPMRPLIGYHGRVTLWSAPPPSGVGTSIIMIMGHDRGNRLRLVGGNRFTAPSHRAWIPKTNVEFFDEYDRLSDRMKEDLVRAVAIQSIAYRDTILLQDVTRECEVFNTMPIFLVVLTRTVSLFHVGPAVIHGDHPADFSYEFFGEVR